MKLYLMRHGQAASPQQDPEQGLTADGREDIERLAIQLEQQGIRVNQVFHSEKPRARQSAEIMASHIAPDVKLKVHEHIKPNDDPQQIIPELDKWQEDTLITSHLPFIPNLLSRLTDAVDSNHAISFEPGTVVCLEREADTPWHFVWVASP